MGIRASHVAVWQNMHKFPGKARKNYRSGLRLPVIGKFLVLSLQECPTWQARYFEDIIRGYP